MENTEQPIVTEPKLKYAGFGKRYAALWIDRVIIVFFCSPFYWEIQRGLTWYLKRITKATENDYGFSSKIYSKTENLTFLYFALVVGVVSWCYYAGMESSPWRATLGKKLLGLEVTDEDGERISFLKATGRYFGKILSGIVLCLGYLSMLGSVQKQTWHDYMSGCLVREK